jgi:hypothetical protein
MERRRRSSAHLSHRRAACATALALGTMTGVALADQAATSRANAAHSGGIIERLGEVMSESSARHEIAFRPFSPPREITAAALLPPFHGDDIRANRGIAFAYLDDAGRRYVLAQWPAHGGSIDRFALRDEVTADCPDARIFPRGTKPNGIVWSTPHGFIMTLQADGANDARTLEIEWNKLIRRGACR